MRLLTSYLLEETAVTVDHRLYTAVERAAFPPKKIAVHRRPFLGDFLSTEPGYLDGTLPEPSPPYVPRWCRPGGWGLPMTAARSYENIHFYGKSTKIQFFRNFPVLDNFFRRHISVSFQHTDTRHHFLEFSRADGSNEMWNVVLRPSNSEILSKT